VKYYFTAAAEFSEISFTVNFTVHKFETKVINALCAIVYHSFNLVTLINQHSAKVGAHMS